MTRCLPIGIPSYETAPPAPARTPPNRLVGVVCYRLDGLCEAVLGDGTEITLRCLASIRCIRDAYEETGVEHEHEPYPRASLHLLKPGTPRPEYVSVAQRAHDATLRRQRAAMLNEALENPEWISKPRS